MQYQSFLIKYAEIGTKGKNRYMFEDALIKQIRYALRDVDGHFEVTKESGRIYVKAETDYDYDDAVEALKRVFGIADICPMVQIEDKDYENLKQHVVEYMDQVYPDKNITFKVNARRGDKQYPVTSEQINRDMGEVILEAFPQMRVDVHHPDVILHVEVRQRINLFSLMIPGPGGMPVGTNGRAMLLLSGGIDSPVASWMIAKRGVELECVHFFSYPYTSERAKEKVLDLARRRPSPLRGLDLLDICFRASFMPDYEQAIRLLDGKFSEVEKELEAEMFQASEELRFEQAAELLKLNAATVRRYCCTGRIRKACRVGRSYRIPAEALELFMELNPKPSDNVPA